MHNEGMQLILVWELVREFLVHNILRYTRRHLKLKVKRAMLSQNAVLVNGRM